MYMCTWKKMSFVNFIRNVITKKINNATTFNSHIVRHQHFAATVLLGTFPFCYVCFYFYIKNKHDFTGKVPYKSVLLLCTTHTVIYPQCNVYLRFKITGKTYVTGAAWRHFIYCMFIVFCILRKGFQLYITNVQTP